MQMMSLVNPLQLCALALVIFFVGCGKKSEPTSDSTAPNGHFAVTPGTAHAEVATSPEKAGQPPRPMADRLVMIVVDALRADRLGCYGFDKPTSPAIDRLAAEGVLFERLHAASPWTAPSFGTIFTGVSPTVHGAGAMLARGSHKGETIHGVTVGGLRGDLPTLAQLLPKKMRKGAIVNNAFVSKALGFAKGFDDFDYKIARLTNYRTADQVTDRAKRWLSERGDEPFFLLAHYFDPHIQYAPPSPYREQFAPGKPGRIGYPFTDHQGARSGSLHLNDREKAYIAGLYQGEVAFADHEIGRLMDWMEAKGMLDDTWVVFTSDHGEEHFEHGSFEHGHRYEEEVVHVPFIVRAPHGRWRAGTRVPGNVSHVDLLPTILALFGVAAPAHVEGESLWPMVEGGKSADHISYMEFNLFRGQSCALFDGRYKMVRNLRSGGAFMYDLLQDPLERQKITEQGNQFQRLARLLDQKRKALTAAARAGAQTRGTALSEETADALKSLGYVQ